MEQQVLNNIMTEINTIPEDKIKNLIEYIHFLKWYNENNIEDDEDYFSSKEIKQIKTSEHEPGIDWREVRNDV